MGRGSAVGLVVLFTALTPSCGDDDAKDSSAGFCPRYAEKLASCGLGEWTKGGGFFCREGVDAADACKNECLLARSCQELTGFLCNGQLVLMDQCIADCEERFVCDSGETVPLSDRCDGYEHCGDASDEKACESFACDNGARFPIGFRCDGPAQCPDASDEVGCPGRRVCQNGDSLLAGRFCDGAYDCFDGDDEAGCAGWVDCADGSRVSPFLVCDGTLDCPDGADEHTNCGVTLAQACKNLGSTP